jgi:hypothetical protein
MGSTQQPRSVTVVRDLGLRSDPSLHRAQCGPWRVRIEARQRSGWRQQDFGEAERADRHIGLVIVMERNVEEERAHRKPAACPAFALRQRELPAAARKSEIPLSRFPRGKAGAGGFPPRRWHAVCQQTALAHIDAAAPPARGVSKRSAEPPLRIPPMGPPGLRPEWVSLDLRDRTGEKIKDGRHVGLDFYDLLIEASLAIHRATGGCEA